MEMVQQNCNSSRNIFWDVAKGVGILLVLLGHNFAHESLVRKFIFEFHMPLFFFISGVFFRPARFASVSEVVRYSFLKLGIPFFFFTILYWCFLAVTGSLDVGSLGFWIELYRGRTLVPSWFLTCLAMTICSAYVLDRTKMLSNRRRTIFVLLGCFILSGLLSVLPKQLTLRMPLMAATVPCSLFFFVLGYKINKIEDFINRIPLLLLPVMLALSATLVLLLSMGFPQADIEFVKFGSVFAFFPGAILGIMMTMIAAKLIILTQGGGVMQFIGMHSLVFFLLEWQIRMFFYNISSVRNAMLGLEGYQRFCLVVGVTFVLQILLCRPITGIINKINRLILVRRV